ncbi:MAG: hypothetical protein HWN81_22550 [Candidatus Lokiarchaeota archaeon]|nr:hypothetical protein [Candidatus Lokiarchaeota archaeon]
MTRLNIEFLINASIESILSNLDTIFENLLQEIKSHLNLDLIFSNVTIIYSEEDKTNYNLKEFFFEIGVRKTQKNNSLTIYISSYYKKFLRLILLREAYKSFIPLGLQGNDIINIFINQKVEIDIQKSEYIEDWKELKRKSVVSYDFMETEFDRLEKFLKQEGGKNKPSPFQFFFSYIKRNIDLIGGIKEEFFSLEKKKGFYDKFFEEYTRKYTEYSDEILETIRVVAKIFFKVKSYRSLLDYQHYFMEYKESGFIQTDLSLRKFTENMQWIKNNTYIAPSYRLNWLALEIVSMLCFMKFNPLIETGTIFNLIKQLPFFTLPTYSKNNFGVEIIGYFICPKVYLKDIIGFLDKFELDGILIDKKVYINNGAVNTINLNYTTSRSIILNPDKKQYKKEYELEFGIKYGDGILKPKLSLLDWLLIDRIRTISITGFGFEMRSETLNSLKSDLLNEIESQHKLIEKVKKNLIKIHHSPDLKRKFLDLIESNQSYGFFYIKQILNDYITVFNVIIKTLVENPSLNNYFQFQEFIKNQGISKTIEDNILLSKLKKNIFKDSISFKFKFKQNLIEKFEVYSYFYNIFKSFNDLKLFDLKSIKSIVKDELLIQKIYQSKEEKLRKSYETYKIYKITNKVIENRLEDFLNNEPPVIQPNLLNTIIIASYLTKFCPILILKDTVQTREGIEKIKPYFPRVIIVEMSDYESHNKYIFLRLLMPNLKINEKQLFYTILYNFFKENIIFSKSFLQSSFTENFSRRDFYDLEREELFYTEDLFKQFYLYAQKTIRKKGNPILESPNKLRGDIWGKKKTILSLINEVENRISRESIDLNISNLEKILDYYKNLDKNISEIERFKDYKDELFFKNYIRAIKFIPSFQSFGFGEYYVYFYPLELEQIDFKHFLHNSFQKIKFSASIDNSSSFFINFIWPYRNPNISLLNWLNKSKKVIREYCLFFIKKVFQIFHFNYNLSVNEWDLDPNRFKIYFQNILFNQDYDVRISELKEFNIGDLNISNYFTPNSPEFAALTQLYNWKSIDLKSYLGTRNYTIINQIIDLLDKKLIFPIFSLKNLDLKEEIYIILPNVKKEHNTTILKIFSFFNVGFIYEIEGEYYIQGFPEEIKFENGLMIKLYLPDCQRDEFEILFNLIFEYLKIGHYVIISDLADGKDFLKSIYGSLDFYKSYNPLKNLIWNNKDKIWMNHKLFTSKFEKIYPSLNIDD